MIFFRAKSKILQYEFNYVQSPVQRKDNHYNFLFNTCNELFSIRSCMRKFIFSLILITAAAFAAQKKNSSSQVSSYQPIGIDDIDTNLEQLRQERQFITNKIQRVDFIKLCEAAEKVFCHNSRVKEISALKSQELAQLDQDLN